jgi:hypothetical protein
MMEMVRRWQRIDDSVGSGTNSACTEAVMVTLVTAGKPLFSICGIITEPIAEVSDRDPEMPLRNVVASTLTTESPPRMRVKPTSTSANAAGGAHSAFRHDGACKDEERDGQHGHLAHAIGDFQHHRLERNADPESSGNGGKRERIGDRHPDREAEEHHPQQDRDVHACFEKCSI